MSKIISSKVLITGSIESFWSTNITLPTNSQMLLKGAYTNCLLKNVIFWISHGITLYRSKPMILVLAERMLPTQIFPKSKFPVCSGLKNQIQPYRI